jgi:VWFA-related protein
MARKFLLIVLVLSVAGIVCAQKGIKVDVDLVMVNVAATDSDNHVITDLKAENFQLFEDKVEQKIQYFSSEVAPLSLGIVFDVSHSMENKLELARAAAVRFLETGTPEDEYFLIEFSNRAEVAEDFTTDISRLRDQLSLKSAAGATALYDAVYLGLSKVKAGTNPRRLCSSLPMARTIIAVTAVRTSASFYASLTCRYMSSTLAAHSSVTWRK